MEPAAPPKPASPMATPPSPIPVAVPAPAPKSDVAPAPAIAQPQSDGPVKEVEEPKDVASIPLGAPSESHSPRQPHDSTMLAVIATVVIILGIAMLMVMAYLRSPK